MQSVVRAWARPMTRAMRPLLAALALIAATASVALAGSLAGDLLGRPSEKVTAYEDTLLDIAREHKLGIIELMAANPGVDPWLPGADVKVLLPTEHILPDAPRRGIVINVAELRLYYFGDPKNPVSFPIGVGRDGYLTPLGSTTVVRKKERPSWYLTPSEIRDNPDLPKVMPPGPDNPLGEHAIYLGWPSYLVHGTNIPWSVGRRASRGCIRLYPEDIAWLFGRVNAGEPVMVVDQPVKIGRRDGALYLEVHPSPKQVDIIEETSKSPGPPEPLPLADWADHILAAAGDDAPRLDWPVIEAALKDRTGVPVKITSGTVVAATAPQLPAAAVAGKAAPRNTDVGVPPSQVLPATTAKTAAPAVPAQSAAAAKPNLALAAPVAARRPAAVAAAKPVSTAATGAAAKPAAPLPKPVPR